MIKIFDTTLRDGEQSPGCSMNLSEKIQMARQLERLGVDVIEAGFASSSPGDFRSVEELSRVIKNATVASLARCVKKDIDIAYDAVKKAVKPRLHVFLATSEIHMKYKLEMTEEEVLERIQKYVSYAKSKCDDIEFSAEDATRSNVKFLCKVFETAIEAGATTINIPDTVGYVTPNEYHNFIKEIKEGTKGIENVDISVHCHNDLGLAVANSLAAIEAGATQVECTINGIGERAGNASLEELVMALKTRKDYYKKDTNIVTEEIMNSSNLLSHITGVKISPNKPIVGKNAFAHESGIHQHGVLKERTTYEIMDPKSIGLNKNSLVLGKHSGKHALRDKLNELGYEINDDELEELFVKFKELSDVKKTVFDEDIHAIMIREFQKVEGGYELIDYNAFTSDGKESKTVIKIKKEDEVIEMVGSGRGPIDAAFDCMGKISGSDIKLKEFSIYSVTQGKDALGETILRVEHDGEIYAGKGISSDIIKSSILAYVNAINQFSGGEVIEDAI
ncbi:2-isopropylmalate synthase [Anaerosphaera multitolerans]|uniref:2-isopropylmalate synthase n=1 Tax=Anaerosphaera multitolerans TaxID=2487351 RepID=A0A437S6J1_9FIRM|nr:2-isopropylmalate synthase [Anaerosphaera multitolerans]RVU54604.1 2-isopropylmalate synthase [Anaerosphaera multitolerans]